MGRLALVVSSGAALLAFASGANATPPSPVSGSETITGATATPIRTADGSTFVATTLTGAISGSFTGTFEAEFTEITHSTGRTNDVRGTFTCTCSIGGKSGTITFRFEGTGTAGPPSVSEIHGETIGGTGGLADLHSNVTVDVVGAAITYTGTAHFDS